jgi:AAA domain, putative AbiEii toxin, Type IV TA system
LNFPPAQTGRGQLTDFNFAHPLLSAIIDPNDEPYPTQGAPGSPLEDEVAQLAREVALDRLTVDTPDDKFRIAVDTRIGAIPDIDRELGVDLRDPEVKKLELESSTPRVRGLRRLLDELVLGPVRIVRDYLNAMTYIGPLREIPIRSFRPRLSPDESRWAQGLAAWDLLYTDTSGVLLDEVNSWLGGEERLRTGYRLEKFQFKEVPVPSRFHQLFDRGLSEDDLGELQELYATLGGRSEIALRDFEKGIIVAPSDVGVGISQMIPVIVGCLRDHQGILAIEQPELHVHPAIQVGLGDLFIQAVQARESRVGAGKTLLVETHSEHIMLRLLRRIRETTENELPTHAIIGAFNVFEERAEELF